MLRALSPGDLMRTHVEALFECDADGRLLRVNEVQGRAAPRFFLGRYPGGARCWFRHGLDAAVAEELLRAAEALEALMPEEEDPQTTARFVEILERDAPVERVWQGPAFTFPDVLPKGEDAVIITPDNADVLKPHHEDWLGDVTQGLPFTAVLVDGRAVSVCCSVRVTDDAHEAGVDTYPDFRGRGLAGVATAAWARLVRRTGALPMYSTSWQNTASRAVARKLGLVQLGADLHIT